ncbi:hypothetical protein JIN85_18400 [Luteolibacter pohnpeiensis]|uniref:Uncharacterized protein n=1 Tax=Luteolibacter pohnpeiensis TaxID=454153 RepID=A0A934S7A3_9BACT|nr:phage protease [Luteolibacter pohnpeiensis]MBK1884395.1 hypothetical protein [Luteolibacter pohnpeiensis]
MNQALIQGADGGFAPSEIVYIPEGEHAIRPTVDGKPGDVVVRLSPQRGHEVAAAFQRDLSRRQGENVRPILDFDHRASGAAAGLPKSFSYRPGVGIVLAVDWTNAGRVAVEGRDYSYFSPEFLLDEDGTPAGLPSRGSIGSLVNNPAFRSMPRIAAADAGGGNETPEQTFTRRASALVAAGEVQTMGEGYSRVAAADPSLYERYCESLQPASERAEQAQRVKAAEEANQEVERRALALVQSGEAASLDDGVNKVFRRDSALYMAYCERFEG